MTCFPGSESYSEMNLTEQLFEFCGEDTKVKYDIPYLDQQEKKNDFRNDKVI